MILFAIISIPAAGYAFVQSSFFTVKEVQIHGPEHGGVVTRAELEKVTSNYLSQHMFAVDTVVLSQDITDQFLAIDSIEVYKELPSRLVVKYEERFPVVAIRLADQIYWVDVEGFVFNQLTEGQLTSRTSVIVDDSSLGKQQGSVLGYKFEAEEIRKMTEISKYDWERFNLTTIAIEYTEKGVQIRFEDEVVVLLSISKNIDVQLEELAVILQDSIDKLRKIQHVDLRFERAVVRYL